MKAFAQKLVESKLVNRRYSLSVTNKIHYNYDVTVPEGFDRKGTWDIEFTSDIPDDADSVQLLMAFHELVIDPLPEYKKLVQIGGGGEKLREQKILTDKEVKANRLTKEQRKELSQKYYNKKPMKKFIKAMQEIFDKKFVTKDDLSL